LKQKFLLTILPMQSKTAKFSLVAPSRSQKVQSLYY
jgi:hypothetical protein